MITNFDQMLEEVKTHTRKSVAIAVAHDRAIVEAAADASRRGIAEPVLVGDEKRIEQIASDSGISMNNMRIVDEPNELSAVRTAVKMTSSGETDMVMKGHIFTDDFLRGVLDKEIGLRTGYLMSHVSILEVKHLNKLDLPQPEGPMIAVILFGCICILISSRICFAP